MIHPDRRDHSDRGVHHVGGVPTSAHADLDDTDVDGRIGEGRERHTGEHLELAHHRAFQPQIAG